MHAIYHYGRPVRAILDYFATDEDTLGATIVLDGTSAGDVLDVEADELHITDPAALLFAELETPGRHALESNKPRKPHAITVLGIARRLSVEHIDRDLAGLRALLIDARTAAGHDTTYDRLAELALRDGIAALSAGRVAA